MGRKRHKRSEENTNESLCKTRNPSFADTDAEVDCKKCNSRIIGSENSVKLRGFRGWIASVWNKFWEHGRLVGFVLLGLFVISALMQWSSIAAAVEAELVEYGKSRIDGQIRKDVMSSYRDKLQRIYVESVVLKYVDQGERGTISDIEDVASFVAMKPTTTFVTPRQFLRIDRVVEDGNVVDPLTLIDTSGMKVAKPPA